jgi:hypothetical protein
MLTSYGKWGAEDRALNRNDRILVGGKDEQVNKVLIIPVRISGRCQLVQNQRCVVEETTR